MQKKRIGTKTSLYQTYQIHFKCSNNFMLTANVMKYSRHPSITIIQHAFQGNSFSLSTVKKDDVIRGIKKNN